MKNPVKLKNPSQKNQTTEYIKGVIYQIISYSISISIGYFTIKLLRNIESEFLKVFCAKLACNISLFIFIKIVKNVSIFDPYWSLSPAMTVTYLLTIHEKNSGVNLLRLNMMNIVCNVYAIRLTLNFFQTWEGLSSQDWRYTSLTKKIESTLSEYPKLIPLAINFSQFFGFLIFPTIVTHLAESSLFYISESKMPLSPLDFIGMAISLCSVGISFLADSHLHMFNKRKDEGDVLDVGLWSISRHPNYLGELGFWWGMWLVGCSTDLRIISLETSKDVLWQNLGKLIFGIFGFAEFKFIGNWFWMMIGPLSINFMFLYVSIPLIEERSLKKRYLYKYVIGDVNRLVFWRRKHKGSVMERYKDEYEEWKKNTKKEK